MNGWISSDAETISTDTESILIKCANKGCSKTIALGEYCGPCKSMMSDRPKYKKVCKGHDGMKNKKDKPRAPCDREVTIGTLCSFHTKYPTKNIIVKAQSKAQSKVQVKAQVNVQQLYSYNTFENDSFYWNDLCKHLDATEWNQDTDDLINYLKVNLPRVLALINDNVAIKQSSEQYFDLKKFSNFSTQLIHRYKINEKGIRIKCMDIALWSYINAEKKHFRLFNQTLANYQFDNPDPDTFICSRRFVAKQIENFETDSLKVLLKYVHADLFSGNDLMFEYEMDKLGIMCKYPHLKTEIITLLISEQGCGKNLYTDFLCEYVFGSYNCIDNMPGVETLLEEKNGEQFGKKFIVVNEMSSTRDKFMSNFNKLKSMVTEKHQRVRMMYMNGFMAKQATEYYCLSNHKNSYVIESAQSRREFVPDISEEHADDRVYWGPIRKAIKNQDCGNAFYSMLLARPITYDDFMSKAVPMSKTKQEIVNNCKSDKQLFVEELVEQLNANPEMERKYKSTQVYARYRTYCEANGCVTESSKKLVLTLNQMKYYSVKECSGWYYTF
jgi:adenylate kinase family enzyme